MINNQKESPLDNKIEKQTVHAIAVSDYLSWAASSESYNEILAIPPIQRGFVWKPKQIQDLWDSLLRGMPIGSLLVQKFKDGESARVLGDGKQLIETQQRPGWYLLDGQQRTLSMLLGFPCNIEMPHKLWVDLSDNGYSHGARFQFRVTTEHQPFGYRPNGKRLSLHDRREARKRLENNQTTNKELFDAKSTRPWKADQTKQKYMFLVPDLWHWMNESGNSINQWISRVLAEINDELIVEGVEERINSFGNGLLMLKKQWLALIEVENHSMLEDEKDRPDQDYLTLLFERVSRSGTQLSAEDLLFSMIKQAWPSSHNLVNELHKRVGVMMSSTDFVMTAFRLSSLRTEGIGDQAQPRAIDFHRHLSTLLGSQKNPGVLRDMIEYEGKLVKPFEELKNCISYRGENDIGLPNALLPWLERPLLQVLLHWFLNVENEKEITSSRDDIICFILFWMVSRPVGAASTRIVRKASEEAIKKLNETEDKKFPAQILYQELTTGDADQPALFRALINPLDKVRSQTTFDSPSDRAKLFFGEDGVDLYHQFTNRKQLLLWHQRKWVETTYNGVNFLSGQDEDTVPYDFDHLIPQSNWASFRGWKDHLSLSDMTKGFGDSWTRGNLGNSIGNYRVMDASDNRSRGDTPLTEKGGFLDSVKEWEDYAFLIADNEVEAWCNASPTKENDACWKWDDTRVLAFQDAVESRVLYLYKCLYEDAGFEKLVKS